MHDADLSQALAEQVRAAAESGTPLLIRGGGTKDFYGLRGEGEPLSMVGHRGIVSYEPTELVITARAGTPLAEVEQCLRDHGQQLPFEPPAFGAGATIGGAVASGLSGPRRAFAGAVRDNLLGVKLINGRGQILSFGGQVMKNVAGYDLSRINAGALGTLGVLLEVSLKVLPRPAFERTAVFEMDEATALARLTALGRTSLSITATAHDGERLYVRVCGGERSLEAAEQVLDGQTLPESRDFWHSVREHSHPFFDRPGPLWRLSLPPAAPSLGLGETFIEWGGAQRWLRSDAPAEVLRDRAAALGGHATLFRGHGDTGEVFHPLTPALLRLHRNLKQAMDPAGIFNRHRMYSDF
ncbi:glycolate oxidase subunit GlcE [Thioalkalivibrio sulfidiphilus]|uniref:glycolate oxidase subunit GlcE n=1 Tax=Thioalkalivibrio sulfidiphilus TaxID=1033854 RepID=UPI00037BBC08|nr:glycolate oxidase subunit GlcE [Thioalkalivibrio sulfidiphilus]